MTPAPRSTRPPLGYGANHLTGDPGYGPIFGEYIKDKTYTITSWGIPTSPADKDNAEGGNTPEQKLIMDELLKTNGREYQGFKWRYGGYHHITQSGWICTRILAKAAAELGPDLTRVGFKTVLESRGWDSGVGVTLHWPAGNHNGSPYSYNREFIYKWISAAGRRLGREADPARPRLRLRRGQHPRRSQDRLQQLTEHGPAVGSR